MKYYELTYLISPHLSTEEAKAFSEKINSLIEKEGGILSELKNPTQQKLAYPIKKEVRAYLSSLTFHLLPEKLENLKMKLKTLPEILRFLLFTKKVAKVEIPAKKIVPKIKMPLKKEKKVELEEIEKKLEEILGE